ncbi:hypothetical protein K504DRAFT_458300 [Pleomassaria siparia CBS 279.74]|uniref:DUF4238 domain-containing protein n=1 Tax=Pleomassaria siparia CBS 279.74 TaxID=1314801 RepID=A0A6G1K4L5_9PLEO|nr:hypothetical protein K504DRAFT_458300 [Pleomassaria siparia CBS 279.74]
MAGRQDLNMEYHHYIPQFILRNFSHKYRGKRNQKMGLYPKNDVLNIVDLQHEEPRVAESPNKRTFGLMDMYLDALNASDRRHLETEIGVLERKAGIIIANIKRALESGSSGVSMRRAERNTLRKFLFVMKYRGRGFHRRFYGDDAGDYTEDDKVPFENYMKKKGYKNPVEVWIKSIKTILDLNMDLEGEWMQTLLAEIYPDDAKWFIMHVESFFLALCTPQDAKDEFILTEDCYNVREGPNQVLPNAVTGEYEVGAYTSYHEFSPITPRLIMVLRSFLLPEPEEDLDKDRKDWRKKLFEDNAKSFIDPAKAKSILEDLPIHKPRNSYSQVTAEGIRLLPGEDGTPSLEHKFTFPFFKIQTDHVRKMNDIFFDNAYLTSTIAFSSRDSFKSSLEHFLQLPVDQGFKVMLPGDNDARLMYLKKLERCAHSMGSSVVLRYLEAPSKDNIAKLKRKVEAMQRRIFEHAAEEPTGFMQLYRKLGGSRDTIICDLDQVQKMRFLRIKIDVCTQGLLLRKRREVRNNLRDLYCHQTHPRRLWLYAKGIRDMGLSLGKLPTKKHTFADVAEGPEDVIVKVSHLVRPGCLGPLLYFTVIQDIEHRRNPGLSPSSQIDLSAIGRQHLLAIRRMTIAPGRILTSQDWQIFANIKKAGSIRDCGIECIERTTIAASNMLRLTKMYEGYKSPTWSVDKNIEILIRYHVRDAVASLLAEKVPKGTAQELIDVLFNIVYPTYRKSQR